MGGGCDEWEKFLHEAGIPQPGEIPTEQEIVDEREADAFAARVERHTQMAHILRSATATFVAIGGTIMCTN